MANMGVPEKKISPYFYAAVIGCIVAMPIVMLLGYLLDLSSGDEGQIQIFELLTNSEEYLEQASIGGFFSEMLHGGMTAKATIIGFFASLIVIMYVLMGDGKRYHRKGSEHGSARWGSKTEKDIIADTNDFYNNVICASDIMLVLDRKKRDKNDAESGQKKKKKSQPKKKAKTNEISHDTNIKVSVKDIVSQGKEAGKIKPMLNLNQVILGGSGTGKSRFFVKPNLLMCNTSYIVTDPSGELVQSCGQMLINHGYKIKVFNLNDMKHSSNYNPFHYADPHNNLPKCLNDIYAIRQALIVGLNAKADNIYLYGENQTVYINDFYLAFNEIIKQINNTDTFIFYFSGHGYKQNNNNYLAFSNGFLSIEAIIRDIDNISCKNKIVIIDSCHSGNKDVYLQSKIDINETADQFVGHGCAIMASCDLEEYSGFDPDVDLSLYTRILCEALTARSIIKQGKKSLEDIKTYVDRLVNIANQKSNTPQHNAFRSNILGTIFFDIEKFLPYQTQHIYKETDKYIIYSVEPSHANVKRISMTVILRFPCSPEELAVIANEITNEAIHYEVYDTKQSEWRFKGLPNNIIFTYYGYDENDVINHNYAYRTIWVDENQDKSNWYRSDDKSSVIDDIWVCTINSYDFMKKFISENTADNDQLITATRNCMYKMIMEAEKFLCQYREYLNKTITEQELITNTKIILEEIRNLYFEQSDFPIATNELRNWQTAFSNLASVIDDFVVCYDANSIKNRDSRNRMQLVELTIKRYNQSLEKIKSVDITLAQQLKKTGDTNE